MKKRLILILITLASVVLLSGQMKPATYMPVSAAPPSSDVAIVHYSFDNVSTDASGNGNHATTVGMLYDAVTPAQGTHSGDFDGTLPQFTIPAGVILNSTWSASVWVRVYTAGNYNEILSPYIDNNSWEYWRWWLDGIEFDMEFRGYQNTTNTLDLAKTNNAEWINSSSWMHLVLIYANGVVSMYKNGVLVTMADAATWNSANMKLTSAPFNVGRYFSGNIDDLSIYNQGLSQINITFLYNGGIAGAILTAF